MITCLEGDTTHRCTPKELEGKVPIVLSFVGFTDICLLSLRPLPRVVAYLIPFSYLAVTLLFCTNTLCCSSWRKYNYTG